MNIGNPINSVPRYAKLFVEGIRGKPASLPHLNTPGAGRVDNAIYNAAMYANQNPLYAGGAVIGGVLANNMLDNPIGAVIDTATFGATDFDGSRLSVQPQLPQNIQMVSGIAQQPMQTMSLPALDEAERKRQIQYLQRKAATDVITINALQQQPGMENYQ